MSFAVPVRGETVHTINPYTATTTPRVTMTAPTTRQERRVIPNRNAGWPCECWTDVSGRTSRSSVSTCAGIGDRSGEDQSRSSPVIDTHGLGRPVCASPPPWDLHGCRGHAETVPSLFAGQGVRERRPHDPRSDLMRHRNPIGRHTDGTPRSVASGLIAINSD